MIILPPSDRTRGTPDRPSVQEAVANAGLPDVAVLALQQGRLIEAIKLIRTANPGLDLVRAKALMERMQAQAHAAAGGAGAGGIPAGKPALALRRQRPPTVAMGDPPGQLRWLLAVLVMLVAAAWIGLGSGA